MKSLRLLLVLALYACGGGDAPTGADESSDAGLAVDASFPQVVACEGKIAQPEDSEWTIVSGGKERTLLVHVPASYDASTGVPLVLNFHGYTSSATQQQLLASMDDKSDTEGFISVHPNGTGVPSSWNAGECCGQAQADGVDDVQFVRDMLSELENRLCIDSTRIYATGMSNGGFLSHRLGCELSDKIAAIGPVAGHLVQLACEPARPVPVAHFHGTLDTLVPYAGNASLSFPPVEESIASWAQRNGCGTTTEEVFNVGDSLCRAYVDCPEGGEVILCAVDGGGHTWPGGLAVPTLGKTTTSLSATDFMWDFFQRQQLVIGD